MDELRSKVIELAEKYARNVHIQGGFESALDRFARVNGLYPSYLNNLQQNLANGMRIVDPNDLSYAMKTTPEDVRRHKAAKRSPYAYSYAVSLPPRKGIAEDSDA